MRDMDVEDVFVALKLTRLLEPQDAMSSRSELSDAQAAERSWSMEDRATRDEGYEIELCRVASSAKA